MCVSHTLTSLPTHIHHSDEDEAAQVLLDNGANVNARSRRGLTALNISAAKGNISVLKVLLKHPNIDIHVQVISL